MTSFAAQISRNPFTVFRRAYFELRWNLGIPHPPCTLSRSAEYERKRNLDLVAGWTAVTANSWTEATRHVAGIYASFS